MVAHVLAMGVAPLLAAVAVFKLAWRPLGLIRRIVGRDRMLELGSLSAPMSTMAAMVIAVGVAAVLPRAFGAEAFGGALAGFSAGVLLHGAALLVVGLRSRRRAFRVVAGRVASARVDARLPVATLARRVTTGETYACTGPAQGYLTYTLRVGLRDGTELANIYLDRAARDADADAIEVDRGYRDA